LMRQRTTEHNGGEFNEKETSEENLTRTKLQRRV
jgi:hypothetical protein